MFGTLPLESQLSVYSCLKNNLRPGMWYTIIWQNLVTWVHQGYMDSDIEEVVCDILKIWMEALSSFLFWRRLTPTSTVKSGRHHHHHHPTSLANPTTTIFSSLWHYFISRIIRKASHITKEGHTFSHICWKPRPKNHIITDIFLSSAVFFSSKHWVNVKVRSGP